MAEMLDYENSADTSSSQPKNHETNPEISAALRSTAYHEAGHAVMAHILGRPVQKVTVAPAQLQTGGIRLGACDIKKGRNKATRDALADQALILLAGMVAESHFTGRYCQQGAAQDLMNVHRLLQSRAGNPRQLKRLENRLIDKAETLLQETVNAKAIERIAQALIEQTSLSGRAVRHLHEQAAREFS